MTFLMGGMLTVLLSATATFAQRQSCDSSGRSYNNASYQNRDRSSRRVRNNERRSYNNAYYQEQNRSGYYDNNYSYDNRSAYQKHRKKINYGASIGAGAIIGALIGGKKGALIGAGAGVAAGAIITKKQKPKTIYYGY